MSYASPAELIAAVPSHLVAHLTGTPEPDEAAIGLALEDASAEIDSYLAARYQLPLAAVPAVLRRLSIDIAVYRMQALRSLGDIEDSRKRYEDAVKFLMRVADGQASLGLPVGGDAGDGPSASGIAFVAPSRIMNGLGY